jgi:hypothetical protein
LNSDWQATAKDMMTERGDRATIRANWSAMEAMLEGDRPHIIFWLTVTETIEGNEESRRRGSIRGSLKSEPAFVGLPRKSHSI